MKQYYDFLQFGVISMVAVLVITLIKRVFRRTSNDERVKEEHNQELERHLAEFEPRPLIEATRNEQFHEIPTVSDSGNCFNFAKVDYLSLAGCKVILDSAAECIRKYSVGTCGPRGFFGEHGTIDIHLELEDRLAKFMKVQCGIVYSYSLITISSCIHCFCKRDTIVFIDENANYAIQTGVTIAGSKILTFKHNDVEDFTAKVKQMSDENRLKILVIEGISMYDGSLCPFPDFLKVCKEQKVRVLLDESISIGVLGGHGRGITEHFAIDSYEIDVIIGSLEHALAGHGGFCVGLPTNIHPQRLTSIGYVFSASLPTFCAQVAITTLELVGGRPKRLQTLSTIINNFLCSFPELHVKSHRLSPVKIFSVRNDKNSSLTRQLQLYFEANRIYLLEWHGCLKMNLFLDLEEPIRLNKFFRVFSDGMKLCLKDKVT